MRDHNRDGLLRPMHCHSATPRRAGGSGPIDNSTNRSPIGQRVALALVGFRADHQTAPDPLVTHHDRRRSTCELLH
jgi:hypothetical protein